MLHFLTISTDGGLSIGVVAPWRAGRARRHVRQLGYDPSLRIFQGRSCWRLQSTRRGLVTLR